MSLPFVFGAAVTGRSGAASAMGSGLYVAGGWLFAAPFAWLFEVLGRSGLWLRVGICVLHGVWLLVVFLNVGMRTPLVTMVGQAVYGGLIGFGYAPG